MDSELSLVLKSLDCLMLKHKTENEFEIIFGNTSWFKQLFHRELSDCNGKIFIDQQCPFLDDFLIDARTFWQQMTDDSLDSGLWTQQCDDDSVMHLEAQAIYTQGKSYLLIKNLAKKFAEKQRTLQAAREMIIANEDLVAKHNYTQERIESLLSESDNLKFVLDTVSQAVDSVNTAIIITDPDFNSVMENQAVTGLFDLPGKTNEESALKTLFSLLDKQYPEFSRMLCSAKPWQGELCWMQPPFNMKWFMVSIVPVTGNDHLLNHWLFLISDISRVKYLQQQNEKLTLIDNLTELPNRAYFWNALDSMITSNMPFYLVLVDIHNFKTINDEFGHTTGDEVLTLIAEKLRLMVKKDDVVARIGGDEFAIIVRGITTEAQCNKVIERIESLMLNPYLQGKIKYHNTTLKLGVTAFPQDGQTVEKLLKCADIAVSHSKAQLDNRCTYYSPALEAETIKQAQLKTALAEAIEKQQFELYFQPIYESASGKAAKVEALIRWHHPQHGCVMPNDFIPLAEETGLILPLGRWTIIQACQTLKILQQQQIDIRMTINLSPLQLHDASLPTFIAETIEQQQVNPQQVELEVTESLLINNFDAVQKMLQALREVGLNLSVDDFGTGYSSLSYLKQLPIDTLKIDRSFVMDLANDVNDKAIVSAVIAMAHKLNLTVVAEGVEQQTQLDYLQENHCDFIQGYLFSKPLPLEQLIEKLKAS